MLWRDFDVLFIKSLCFAPPGARRRAFPMTAFLSAGVVNFFVPSGGGQWAVQGPVVMPAAEQMGIEFGRAAMGIAWGDQWTNMIQPFWALPALGIAGLHARDIMGYLVIVTIFVGVIACIGAAKRRAAAVGPRRGGRILIFSLYIHRL